MFNKAIRPFMLFFFASICRSFGNQKKDKLHTKKNDKTKRTTNWKHKILIYPELNFRGITVHVPRTNLEVEKIIMFAP